LLPNSALLPTLTSKYTDNWHKDLQALLGKGQINTVIDGAGGKAYAVYPRVMAIGGIIVNYGQTSAKDPVTFPMTYVLKNIDLRGSTMGSRKEFYDMVEFVDKHKIKPVVSQVWQGLTESNIENAFAVMR
jgi:D-arabinose 1-dehydrogenase-like Zn-dependent alcohol dehydrogenase